MMSPDGPLGGRIAAPAGPKRPKEVALMAHGLQKKGDLGLPFPVDAQNWISNGFRTEADPENNLLRHRAIDWALHAGTSICAMRDGQVKTVVPNGHVRGAHPYQVLGTNVNPGLGNRVYVLSDTGGGNGFQSRYGHLSQVFVEEGAFVRKGDLLGLSGHTGWSSGPHVHVELRPYEDNNSDPGDPIDLGDPFDCRPYLPSDYDLKNNTFVLDDRPLAHSTGGDVVLYSPPDDSSTIVGELAAPAATWLKSYTPTNDEGSHVLLVGGGTLSLSLNGSTVTLTVTGVSFNGTNNDYVAVTAGSLPANLRPPIWTPTYENDLNLYVSQDGRIYYQKAGPDSAPAITTSLSWRLAYSVIGKDGPTASWWQIVVPGLDPAEQGDYAGEVGWVQASAVTVTDPGSLVQVTWPPPPYKLEASGTYTTLSGGLHKGIS